MSGYTAAVSTYRDCNTDIQMQTNPLPREEAASHFLCPTSSSSLEQGFKRHCDTETRYTYAAVIRHEHDDDGVRMGA